MLMFLFTRRSKSIIVMELYQSSLFNERKCIHLYFWTFWSTAKLLANTPSMEKKLSLLIINWHYHLLMNLILYSLKFSWNGKFSSFVDKIFMDCRSTALNYTVRKTKIFVGTPKSTKPMKIFILENFRLYIYIYTV